MKANDFSYYLTRFLSVYLIQEKAASTNTIKTYSYSFVLFIKYIINERKIKIHNITFSIITKELVIDFLNYLQNERKCSNSTRNARLAAIRSFFQYLQYERVENLFFCQDILSIKQKNTQSKIIKFLSLEGVKLLLEQPDLETKRGRRDLALLSLTYDCGARVQEIIDLTPSMLRLNKPSNIILHGKGDKDRLVPLQQSQVDHLKKYLSENKLDLSNANMYPLFSNSRLTKFTRAGVNHILKKYVKRARAINPQLIPENISCHSLRHSKAMHLLEGGVNIVYIRDFLGHVSVVTTEIYARASSKQKREAIEKAYININPEEKPRWVNDNDLLQWLTNNF